MFESIMYSFTPVQKFLSILIGILIFSLLWTLAAKKRKNQKEKNNHYPTMSSNGSQKREEVVWRKGESMDVRKIDTGEEVSIEQLLSYKN